ncbi:hypothetical protein GC173_12920 [bacterium]|nr:hypothetical protein [bacterium]
MSRHRIDLSLFAVAVLSVAMDVSAQPDAGDIQIPFVNAAPTIDGTFGTGEWSGALTFAVEGTTPQQNPGWNPLNGAAIQPSNLSYNVSVMHNGQSLYIAFDVTDNNVSDDYTASRPDHTEVWNDDCTEVFIDGDLDRDVTESASGSPAGDQDWREGMQPHFGVNGQHHWDNNSGTKGTSWFAATGRTATGYRTEYRFLLSGIDTADGEGSFEALKVGDTFGFSVLVNDDDNGGDRENQLAWWGGGTNDSLYRTQSNWGRATLMPDPQAGTYGIPYRTENTTLLLDSIPPTDPGQMEAVRVFPRLTFSYPVLLLESPDASGRLFVVQQNGLVKVFPKSDDPAPATNTTYLDASSLIRSPFNGLGGGEEGLLGLAFDPDFATTGELYVYYSVRTGTRRSRISRFTANPPSAASINLATEEVILEISQPFSNHNGGMMAFGPDKMLYIGMGDGGSADDPQNNGQNTATLLGSMLRIDVRSAPDAGLAYKIPTDNPFYVTGPAGTSTRKETWAYGLRNPWRWSFDAQTGHQLVADVGQNNTEEVNILTRGGNYGWRLMEGSNCYIPSNCNQTGLVLPIAEYSHSFGNSITGGFVYYGSEVPQLYGRYLYGDYGSGRVWSLDYNRETGVAATPVQLADLPGNELAGFGQDKSGEVYLLYIVSGGVYVLRPGSTPVTNAVTTSPNPPVQGQPVTITYDATGRVLAGQSNVYIHLGRNGWTNIISPDPQLTSLGNNRFSYTYTVPSGTTVLDFVFNNGAGTWDNNDSADWHINVASAKSMTLAALKGLADACNGSTPFPTRLSDIPALLNAGKGIDQTDLGIIPYQPSAQLWSDNAHKERFLVLPHLDQVGYTDIGGWDMGEDAVLIKNFSLPLDERDPEGSLKRIETRVMIKNCDEWFGFSFEWNEEETDAVLLTAGKSRPFTIIDAQGSEFAYNWLYPSRDQCSQCHTNAANNVLGVTTAALNSNLTYPRSGVLDNQLRALDHISLFASPGLPDAPANLPKMPSPFDETAPIRDRARAYLAANCAHCHQPGGGGGGAMDLRWHVADEATGMIDGIPGNTLGVQDARIVSPGSPTKSTLYLRMTSTDPSVRMPRLATSRVDEAGTAVVAEWIESLGTTTPRSELWMTY